jgi:pilus assembly protein TadC
MINNILIIGNVVAFLIIAFIILYKKKQKMIGRLTPRQMLEQNKVLQNRYFKWLNPFTVEDNAKVASWDFNFKKYWLLVMLGSFLSLVFIFLVLRTYYLFPLGILAGFALPNVLVFLRHRKRKDEISNEISSYINTTANLTITFGDPYRALTEIVEKKFIEEPLLSDLAAVVMGIESGLSMKDAFKPFNEKYNNDILNIFHDNLILYDKYGGSMEDVLIQISKDYDRSLQRRLMFRNEKYPHRQAFYTLLKLVVLIPFVMLGISYEYYTNFVNDPAGKLVFTILIGIGIICTILVEFQYDNDEIFEQKR